MVTAINAASVVTYKRWHERSKVGGHLIPITALRSAGYALSLAVSLVTGSAGCGGRNEPEGEAAPDPSAPVPLTINNNNWLDAVIFIYHDGELSRVGTVTAASSTNFFLAPWMLGPTRSVRLVAHPVGSARSINTELIHVQPGQFIEWRLENQLSFSSVAVY
jgi:hypothetical protein